jgi:hypothetical protein
MQQHNSLLLKALNCGWALNLFSKKLVLAACFSALLISCNDPGIEPQETDGPSAKGIVTTPSVKGIVTTPSIQGIVTSPSATAATVTLNKVDIMIGRSSTAVGTVLVQVKSMDGTIVASSELAVDAIPTTASWITFTFPEDTPVTSGVKYRMEVTRSHPPVTGNGQVYLGGAVSSSADPYPHGASDRSSSVFDYTFRTYASSVVDQQQLRYTSPVPIVPSNLGVSTRWQEFVVGSF